MLEIALINSIVAIPETSWSKERLSMKPAQILSTISLEDFWKMATWFMEVRTLMSELDYCHLLAQDINAELFLKEIKVLD